MTQISFTFKRAPEDLGTAVHADDVHQTIVIVQEGDEEGERPDVVLLDTALLENIMEALNTHLTVSSDGSFKIMESLSVN